VLSPRFFLPPLAAVLVSLGLALGLSQLQVGTAETAPPPSPTALPPGSAPVQISSVFTPEVLYWEEKILAWSERWEVDPNLVATVIQIESCGDPLARSSAGASGLFQVMPYHFQGDENPFHPGTNARRGIAYLKRAQEQGQSIRLALAGYNGGIQGASRPPSAWPAETRRYVYWGLGIYHDARAGRDHSERLQEWLDAGGRSLCRSAAQRQNR
jgi:soluble lytic murein transglycosylase-like protein